MLVELRVQNLLLIERAELRWAGGLNAITGETGAGKTVLAHALDLLLGGRPRTGIVRPGAEEAYVEGVFELPPGLLEDPELTDLCERAGLTGDDDEAAVDDGAVTEVVLARRVTAAGRTRAYVQGRSASAPDLALLGSRLVSFYGQHEHRKLTVAGAQLELLDAFCGKQQLELRAKVSGTHARVTALERELDELRARAGARDRDLDLLAFEIDEIDAAALSEGERAELGVERERLRAGDALRAAAAAGAEAIAPEAPEGRGAAVLLGEAERVAEGIGGADPELDALAERLQGLRIEAEDLAGEFRRYGEGFDGDPGRLQEVEERLEQYDRLERKHGGSVAAVLAHRERAGIDREALEGAEVALERAGAELAGVRTQLREGASALTAAREAAAPRLAKRVAAELAELAMEDATFAVELEPREEVAANGAERVEFLLAPNRGVPASPVRDTASGGELSRVMLALMTVANAGGAGTLVFDEVDAGIGGQTARAVGERLRALAEQRQVLCITHLPQIASLAERHYRVEKGAATTARDAEPASATVEPLDRGELVEELCRMLGADVSDAGARRHAKELLKAA